MTSDQADKDVQLREIMQKAKMPDANLGELLADAIPLLEDRLTPLELQALKHDLYGFKNETGIEYYQKPAVQKWEYGYMPYRAMVGRERPGRLLVLNADGSPSPVKHDLGKRERFFLAAPVMQIQELLRSPGDTAMVELPDLTDYIGAEEGGTIALVVEKKELQQIADATKRGLIALIDLAITPGRREALEAASEKSNGL